LSHDVQTKGPSVKERKVEERRGDERREMGVRNEKEWKGVHANFHLVIL
jgi:hypothetical protein